MLRRNDVRGRVAALFEQIDLLLIPVQPFASPTLAMMATLGEDAEMIAKLLRFTCPFDTTGNPTITLPAGFTDIGPPLAFQFVARPMEGELLGRARVPYPSPTPWPPHHPAP